MALARKHQMGGPAEPLSLLDMNTPSGTSLTEEDAILRGRALYLAQKTEGKNTAEAIGIIARILRREGLADVSFGDELQHIGDQLKLLNHPYNDDVIMYHALLWKTRGDNGWTLRRNIGECEVLPYLPHILEANKLGVSAEMCFLGEHITEEEQGLSEDISKIVSDPENWKEVSILEFLNGCLPRSKVAPAEGPTSQPVVQIITTKDQNLTWRNANDNDDQNDEEVFSNNEGRFYVRTNSDVRKLYEGRPPEAKGMSLGQLASEYRLLKESDHGYEKIKNSINSETRVGPNTRDAIAGAACGYAPQSMMVNGEKILKRRESGSTAVLHFLYSGVLDRYGNQLLWTPWDQLESVTGDQDENETQTQTRVRLSLFPMSVFPSFAEEENTFDGD